ncbi:amino acid adenylation domain-containing protein [Streptosporangium sp. NBC_01756]|uniref:amino acid adenylation domain-containing protein n=1 Tax=Streptosporangium sp. NBC_01756 TaxID=2975950 RepID=UPI002DDBD7A1|nr:amino acid adenylation domain-containing protein [Streptosporangium sp. NBC_01756]WSC89886.1 amino acid adenylation domain-containing protein [Streptosporangium sp. NBC_01756]
MSLDDTHQGKTQGVIAASGEAAHPMTPNRRNLVAGKFDGARRRPPGDDCLPELLWEQARSQPDRTACVYGDERLTYRELTKRSADLATHLRRLGVAADDCIGLFLEPSIELMTGVWGILCSGGAYLPLSPEYPEERLRYIIEDSRTTVVLTQQGLVARLTELAPQGTKIVVLDTADAFAPAAPPAAPPAESLEGAAARESGTGIRPGDSAYVVYTSGSTGRPKGVVIEHRAIVNQMRWLNTVHRIDRNRIILQKTPMSFDAAQWEILAPACGSTVVMGGPGVYRDPEQLVDTVVAHGVTTLQCVPTLLQALLDTERLGECTSLTQLFSGGEALSRALALRCLEVLPDCELVNLYGPTECTINSSSFTVDRDSVADGVQTIPIGTPAHDTRFYVLDGDRSPVVPGEVGELYIGGVQLARGYLHQPDLTAERFVGNPFHTDHGFSRLYRTGDLAYWNADGTLQFVGRVDNQVKLRGFRIELDEIRLGIERHDWVRNAAVVVKDDSVTGFQQLVAYVELNPKEAALMDQGEHGTHHLSKESRLQVMAQLSDGGCRDDAETRGKTVVDLPGRTPAPEQRRRVFARKTYRFFEGGDVTKDDIVRLLERSGSGARPRGLDTLGFAELGEILRYFGQFSSADRLLPKYGYASPGSLYATQMYLEISGLDGVRPGYHYYHPVRHQLILIREKPAAATARLKIHFMGKRRAIEPIYKKNVREVLEMEAGHMVGLFEEILPEHGLDIRALGYAPETGEQLECADEDDYLGTFEVVPYAGPRPEDSLDVYVQAHPGKVTGLTEGLYRYADGDLHRFSDDMILRKHVVAINQVVYQRSSFGVALVGQPDPHWPGYVDLGRRLHRLQMNDLGFGFMSSGYSSRTGDDLPSARRMESILRACGGEPGPFYFAVGGRVSDEQLLSTGMKEDSVHMRGPTEMIRDDLIGFLPDYMLPNRVVILDGLPRTANGKIDSRALEARDLTDVVSADGPFVAPRTEAEERIARVWRRVLKREKVSVRDDFFMSGGNSLVAMALVSGINEEFRCSLPMQVVFGSPTVEKLAIAVGADGGEPSSRLVGLNTTGSKNPIYCWPGLGGYTMNLRPLAEKTGFDRPFYGVQAYGINEDEVPYSTVQEMAAEDVRAIKRLQPAGPYMLWGYSFGARVAFEAACRLERMGEQVEGLLLIAPGSPQVHATDDPGGHDDPVYANRKYLTILFSVFAGGIDGPLLDDCLRDVEDEDGFISFVGANFRGLDPDLVRRIVRTVRRTYQTIYHLGDPAGRRINAPITILKARGDEPSFIEKGGGSFFESPTVVNLEADHYSILKEPGLDELLRTVRHALGA